MRMGQEEPRDLAPFHAAFLCPQPPAWKEPPGRLTGKPRGKVSLDAVSHGELAPSRCCRGWHGTRPSGSRAGNALG